MSSLAHGGSNMNMSVSPTGYYAPKNNRYQEQQGTCRLGKTRTEERSSEISGMT